MNTSSQKSSEINPSMFDDIEKTIQVHLLDPDHYLYGDVYARVDQIANQNNPRHYIGAARCCAMAK